MISNQKSALKLVKEILTRDYACAESDFDNDGITFHLVKKIEGARKFPLPEEFLGLATMGRGIVVTCSSDRIKWARRNLSKITPYSPFNSPAFVSMGKYIARDRQRMHGPESRYICTLDTFRKYTISESIELKLIEGEEIQKLYIKYYFPNALGLQHNPLRPRLLACSAIYNGKIIGLTAASADCDAMWQVGIDVLPEYRSRGIGKAIVSCLTEALFDIGKLPYYSTYATNIGSTRIAISLGYRPAWVEMYSGESV
jgi:GNAT superfamily N-acetyltransferase